MMISTAAIWLTMAAIGAAPVQTDDAPSRRLAQSYAYEKGGDYAMAVAALTKEGKTAVEPYLLNIRLGWLQYLNGRFDEAERRYQAAIAAHPKSVEAKLGCLLPMLAAMRYKEAETLARQITKNDPRNYYGNLRLVVALRCQRKFDEARAIIDAMLVTYPEDTPFRHQLAILDAAETAGDVAPPPSSEKRLEIDKALAKARESEQNRNYAAALSALQDEYAAHPQDYLLNLNMGWLHYLAGNYRDSAKYYYAAVQASPRSSAAGVGYLLPLLAQARYAAAESFARQITNGDPGNYYGNLRLAFALRLQGKYDEAERVVTSMRDAYPTDVSFLLEMALLNLARDKQHEAKQLFANVLSLDPENVLAREQLGL